MQTKVANVWKNSLSVGAFIVDENFGFFKKKTKVLWVTGLAISIALAEKVTVVPRLILVSVIVVAISSSWWTWDKMSQRLLFGGTDCEIMNLFDEDDEIVLRFLWLVADILGAKYIDAPTCATAAHIWAVCPGHCEKIDYCCCPSLWCCGVGEILRSSQYWRQPFSQQWPWGLRDVVFFFPGQKMTNFSYCCFEYFGQLFGYSLFILAKIGNWQPF